MPRRMLLLLFGAILLGSVGCRDGEPGLLRVTVELPGASPQEVANYLGYPIEVKVLSVLPDVQSVTSISSAGSLETYILVRGSRPLESSLLSLEATLQAMDSLPTGATVPAIEVLRRGATVPAVEPSQVDCVVVDLRRQAMARHNVRISTILATVREKAGGSATDSSRLDKLRGILISSPNGNMVPLTDLADIRIEKQPSHVVTRWPPAPVEE